MELTREIVLAEPPGKRLDSWIAEKVMGWRKRLSNGFEYWDGEGDKPWVDNWSPSADIAAAWEVEAAVMEIDRLEYVAALMQVVWNDMNYIELADPDNMTAWQAIPDLLRATPEQRCKAALLAVMNGEDETRD